MKLNILYIIVFAFSFLKGNSQIVNNKSAQSIVFNKNTFSEFTPREIKMLNTVYGGMLKSEILDRPTRVLSIKEILRNRVEIVKLTDPRHHKPCPMLSEIPLFNIFNKNLKRDQPFDPLKFNPLKYNFEFHKAGFQMFRVDGSNYFIIIKPQHYNK
jgi:hypothetical protein